MIELTISGQFPETMISFMPSCSWMAMQEMISWFSFPLGTAATPNVLPFTLARTKEVSLNDAAEYRT
jgi:carbohydrate-binding DOMON domain-containing protein